MKKIETEGCTVEEIRKQITKEPSTQMDIFNKIVGQITLDEAIESQKCTSENVNADCYYCSKAKTCKILEATENNLDNKFN